jgi:hypothetical protein
MQIIKTIVKVILSIVFFVLVGLFYGSLPAAEQPAFLQLGGIALGVYYVIDLLVEKLKKSKAFKTCGRCLGSGVGTAVNDFGRCSKCGGSGKIEVQDKSPMGILLCLIGVGIVIFGISSLGWVAIAAGVALLLLGIALATDKYMYSDWR